MMSLPKLTTRLRRLRYNSTVRNLVRETHLSIENFILPLFIRHGVGKNHAINSMPGHFQITLENLKTEIAEIVDLKIPAVLLFGIPEHKDDTGSEAYDDEGIVQRAIQLIKQYAPGLLVITDICCCEYTRDGHCGILDAQGVNNDATLSLLQKQAVSHVRAGADIVAPSGMLDGMVAAIRSALDENNFIHIPILSYTMKYASSFYGPFREAAGGSSPREGDRKNHQADFANGNESLREADLDVAEGADILMVKPANMYLDIIYRTKHRYPEIPLAAYQVSGEYAMLHAAADKGWLNLELVMMESLFAIKRAGADIIISYFAKDVARLLRDCR